MTNPHMQGWKDVGGPCGGRIVNAQGDVLADEVDDSALSLMLSVPWLVRGLLEQGEERDGQWHTRECWAANRGCIVACQGAHAALTKAGVLT
jgi:hypothetical protein